MALSFTTTLTNKRDHLSNFVNFLPVACLLTLVLSRLLDTTEDGDSSKGIIEDRAVDSAGGPMSTSTTVPV